MVEIGQLAIKIAGRDAANFCVVVDILDDTYVLIDGNVRRKKCNLKHLEFLDKKIDLKKKASSEQVKKELEKIGIKILKTGTKKEKKAKPAKKRKQKKKPEEKAISPKKKTEVKEKQKEK